MRSCKSVGRTREGIFRSVRWEPVLSLREFFFFVSFLFFLPYIGSTIANVSAIGINLHPPDSNYPSLFFYSRQRVSRVNAPRSRRTRTLEILNNIACYTCWTHRQVTPLVPLCSSRVYPLPRILSFGKFDFSSSLFFSLLYSLSLSLSLSLCSNARHNATDTLVPSRVSPTPISSQVRSDYFHKFSPILRVGSGRRSNNS